MVMLKRQNFLDSLDADMMLRRQSRSISGGGARGGAFLG